MNPDPIIIEALLVQCDGDMARLILEPFCLDFCADDVLDTEELPAPGGMIDGSAIYAKVTLKPGARLMWIASSDAYRDLLWKRPFALATRPTATVDEDLGVLRPAEEAFLASRGLRRRAS